MRHFKMTTLSAAAAQAVLLIATPAFAQSTDGKEQKPQSLETVVVSGQRAALQSAQKKKQEADEIVDSIVAEDIGKLPDRSVTEVLQRIVGVSMDRTAARTDPAHYSVEGSGVIIRGLTYVSSQLNGREIFSANGGRGLSFEDVPPELMQSVNVYKNPSAEQIEGGIGGLVDLRTALPFDYNGFKASLSMSATRGDLDAKTKPSVSGLISNTWNTDLGKVGMLLDVAFSKSSTRSDTIVIDPYYLRTTRIGTDSGNNPIYAPTGDNTWVPRGMSWRSQLYDRERKGLYGALQWKKDNFESSLTYFRSEYNFAWNEFAVSANSDPYNTVVTNGVYDSAGRMVSGVLTNPSAGGHEAETGTRYTDRNSMTKELAWNLSFKPNANWTLTSDLQLVKSRTQSVDSSVATAVMLPKESINTSGSRPTLVFDASDIAYLSNPSNYYWAMTMENFDKGKATQKAWKGDARYVFQDAGPLNDVRFGVRYVERDALTITSVPGYNWSTITHAWQNGWDVSKMATITDYNDPYFKNTFNNFLGGKAAVPAMYFPAVSVAAGFPNSYLSLREHYLALRSCSKETDPGWWQFVTGKDGKPVTNGCMLPWVGDPQIKPLATLSDSDPNGRNEQKEKTTTAYSQLRFSFDDWKLPVDGNVGLRVTRTRMNADGYTVLNVGTFAPNATGLAAPSFSFTGAAVAYKNSYVDVLPSLNLRLRARDDLQFRFAYAKAVSRPGMDQLQAYSSLSITPEVTAGTPTTPPVITRITASGQNKGNPMLEPIQSSQLDLTGEWYFSKSGSLTVAAFDKRLKDIIVNQTYNQRLVDDKGVAYTFISTGPVNGAKGYARGLEMAYQQYFDKLPGPLAGLGMQFNWTYVDSKQTRYDAIGAAYCSAGNGAENLNLYANGCDTDGRSFSNLPLANLSRNTFNLSLLYDRGPVSARLAYSWRERYLYGVGLNTDATGPSVQNGLDTNPNSASKGRANLPLGLPLWADSYGQLDAGVQYKFDSGLTVSLDAQNLTNSTYKQIMQQHIGMMGHSYFTSGRRYSASLRYSF